MSLTDINDSEVAERLEEHLAERPTDPISEALGVGIFVARHRFGLHVETPLGRSPRLAVSRYYWGTKPPVAVDFVKDVRYGAPEVATKRAYCQEQGIRYILCANEWDEEAITGPQAASGGPVSAQPDGSGKTPVAPPRRPTTAPRRRNPSKRR